MEENKELKNEEEVKEETAITTVQGFEALSKSSNTKADIFTNIADKKKLFNLDGHVDCLLNDCEGELIRVKEVLIKRYEKPLKEPIIDEETGEVLKDKEYTMACVLVDDNNKSYATGSKTFTIRMMRYLQMCGISEEGFEIKIVKTKQSSGNKALSFELV